jgi:hypothetical protein
LSGEHTLMADTTTNLSAPKPIASNQLSTDVDRLRTALDTLDTAIATKAATSALTAHIALKNPHGAAAADVGAVPALSNAVTDDYLGNRTANPDLAPSGSVGNLTQWVSWFANRIKTVTGKASWLDAPATTLEAAASHAASQSNPHGTTAAQIGALANVANVVNDTLIGSRTVNQALASPANTGTLTQIVSWFAGRIVAITGRTNWFEAPAITLASTSNHVSNTSNPHATTAAQVGAPTTAGVGATGTWGISISGSAASAAACSGNAATATSLATARTINGVSFDGSQNITITMIKSIQRGQSPGTANRTVTITAVDPEKSVVIANCATGGYTDSGSYQATDAQVLDGCYLLNSTTLQIIAGNRLGANLASATVCWQVVEYM